MGERKMPDLSQFLTTGPMDLGELKAGVGVGGKSSGRTPAG